MDLGMRRFDKIAGSNFEHQRFLLMARRVKYREVFYNPAGNTFELSENLKLK